MRKDRHEVIPSVHVGNCGREVVSLNLHLEHRDSASSYSLCADQDQSVWADTEHFFPVPDRSTILKYVSASVPILLTHVHRRTSFLLLPGVAEEKELFYKRGVQQQRLG